MDNPVDPIGAQRVKNDFRHAAWNLTQLLPYTFWLGEESGTWDKWLAGADDSRRV